VSPSRYLKEEEIKKQIRENGIQYLEERKNKLGEINYVLAQKYFDKIMIEDLELEKQVKTRLIKRGIKTLADVIGKSEEELTSVRGIGRNGSCIYGLKAIFRKYHIDLILPKY
jgi:DNA-directed RNA polymerase alpha subunit